MVRKGSALALGVIVLCMAMFAAVADDFTFVQALGSNNRGEVIWACRNGTRARGFVDTNVNSHGRIGGLSADAAGNTDRFLGNPEDDQGQDN